MSEPVKASTRTGTRKLIMGNHAVSYAVLLSRVQVIAAYPITPQTQVVEMLSEMCGDGRLAARFLKVESEHSALASIIGAASTGVRAFTATSSQGLALMHELIHWTAGSRLPMVMANANRALAPGWSIWADQLDALSQRDTGWLQIYCESNQEILDMTILSYRLAEAISLPVMVVYDAFILSHTSEPVYIPDQEAVDALLPPLQSRARLDTRNPVAFGALTSPDYYYEFRYMIQEAHVRALSLFDQLGADFGEAVGRRYRALEPNYCDGAELVLVTAGALTSTARLALEQLRSRGEKVGLLKLRLFRPFPAQAVRSALAGVSRVAVIDRNLAAGCGGIFGQEVRAALYDGEEHPLVFNYVAGLGGRDVTVTDYLAMADDARKRSPQDEHIIYHGLKPENLDVF